MDTRINNLPAYIPKWLRPYISPVVVYGDIPTSWVGKDEAHLHSITFGKGVVSFKFDTILHSEAIEYSEITANICGKEIVSPIVDTGFGAVVCAETGDTSTNTLLLEPTLYKKE